LHQPVHHPIQCLVHCAFGPVCKRACVKISFEEAGRMDLDLTKFDVPMAIENALILIRDI
jgi:hypothetical protein